MGFFSDLGRVGLGVGTGGLSEVARGASGKSNIFSDLGGALGISKEDIFGETIMPELRELPQSEEIMKIQKQARDVQSQGLRGLTKGPKPSDLSQQIIQQKERAARASRSDTERNLQSQIARRGLGSSSLGLSQLVGLRQREAQQIGDIRSQAPMIKEQLRVDRAKNQLMGASGVMGAPGQGRQFINMGTGQQTGGLAPLIGAGLGGLLGGAGGAQVGMGAGQAASGMFG